MGVYHRSVDRFARTKAGSWMFLNVFNPVDKRLMRWSNGALSSGFGTDFQENSVLLRCTGAKSGKPRDIPLLAKPLDGGWVLIASATGREKKPKLVLQPEGAATVLPARTPPWRNPLRRTGSRRHRTRRAWEAANAQYSGYAEVYQKRTRRRIPVMILAPQKTV
jgi:deazaflavin-dependent oxidoreductase (nitroreductase family)